MLSFTEVHHNKGFKRETFSVRIGQEKASLKTYASLWVGSFRYMTRLITTYMAKKS